MNRKTPMLHNAMILFIAMAVTKVIGAVLKIPLGNILGGLGMGYFSSAYSVFSPIYALTAAAVPTVITKLVAQSCAAGRFRDVRRIKRLALRAALLAGFFGMILIFVITTPFAQYIANSPKSIPAMLVISPSLLFCCVAAVYKGYYEGLSNMLPTAVSQVIEAVFKALLGVSLSYLTLSYTGSLPYAAAAAVLGITISELAGLLFLFMRSRIRRDGISAAELEASPPPQGSTALLKHIWKEMLPITMGALVINLCGLIDLLTITSCINLGIAKDKAYFLQQFTYGLQGGIDINDLGNFIYGSYSGIVSSLFSLIPAMTAMISKSALPDIAAAFERKSRSQLVRSISILFSGTLTLGLPLCFGMAAVAEPLLSLLYYAKPAEAAVCTLPLIVLNLGGISLALAGMLFSIFQAIGRADIPVKLMLLGALVKLACNLTLIPVPELNITGAAISTVACYAVVCVAGMIVLHRIVRLPARLGQSFVKSLLSAAVCGASAYFAYHFFFAEAGGALKLVLAVAAGAGAYAVMIMLTGFNQVKYVISRLGKNQTRP